MTLFPQGYIGRVAQHTGQHLLAHMTPHTHHSLLFGKKNPACKALKAAFIYLAFELLPRTVIIYFFIIIDPKIVAYLKGYSY